MSHRETELRVHHWRDGQARAERLGAHLLSLEGFVEVQPQAPLGGPDGRKDILCRRAGKLYVTACYFPPTPQDYAAVRTKFCLDLPGVKANGAEGFAFITNQRLTLGERNELTGLHSDAVEIFDVERIAHLLDSLPGLGFRAAYLGINMTAEDAASYAMHLASTQSAALQAVEHRLHLIETRFDPAAAGTLADDKIPPEPSLTHASLLMIHQALHFSDQALWPHAGQLRTVAVWLGPPGSTMETATMVPPGPEEVQVRLAALFSWFEEHRAELQKKTLSERIASIVEFHHRFLGIHPFTDGNGRTARFLLSVQLQQFCALNFEPDRLERERYFLALQAADKTNELALLAEVVMAACSEA